MNIQHPRGWASSAPDKLAFVLADSNESLTYAELVQRSDRAAQAFASLGIAPGDTIALLVENHIRYPELVWAAKNSGLRYVAISTHLNSADASYIIRDCGAKLLVTSWKMRAIAHGAIVDLETQPHLLMLDGCEAPFSSYEALVGTAPPEALPGRRRGASMLYSSGTTGRPKGVATQITDAPPEAPPHRHAMLVSRFEIDDNSVFLDAGPLYHAGPLRFMMTVQRCGGVVIAFTRFDAAEALAAIEAYGATHAFFVPTMLARMLKLPAQTRQSSNLSTMRHAIHSAAPCPTDVKRAMIDWWGPVIDELYSGTEGVGHTIISSEEWLLHPGSVGRAAGACSIKIVDANGNILPPGPAGRIMMRNGLQFAYHGDPDKTASVRDEDGYTSLGDVGYLDADGFLYLTDRESHMIISGGVNIYPQEAEAVLGSHPEIEDVAVIGVPHVDMGEEVKAVVQPRSMPQDPVALENDIIDFCRARLSAIKCPKSVDFVAKLPRSEMGKLAKHVIKASYWDNHKA